MSHLMPGRYRRGGRPKPTRAAVNGVSLVTPGRFLSAARRGRIRSRHEEEKMDSMIVWADIPVTDLERAMKFYGAVLQHEFMAMPGMDGIALPAPDRPPGEGAPDGPMPVAFDLAVVTDRKPSIDGCTIYLNAEDGPEAMLERAAAAGGEILMPVTDMGEMVGRMGFFKDSEGNRIGVHKSHPR
jgi:uncharacterized protein